MNEIFGDILYVNIIMDDLLINTVTVTKHYQVFKMFYKEHNVNKLALCKKEVKVDTDKVKAVVDMPEPKQIAEVQTFLGMVTYTCKI